MSKSVASAHLRNSSFRGAIAPLLAQRRSGKRRRAYSPCGVSAALCDARRMTNKQIKASQHLGVPNSVRLQPCPENPFSGMSKERQELLSLGFSEKELRRHLSPFWSLIVDLMGFDTALDLMDRFGGKLVYIPTDTTRDTQLLRMLGEANTKKLCDLWPSQKVDFPPGLHGVRILTRLKGIKMLQEGKSLNAVCNELTVSRSTASAWLRFLSDDARKVRADRRAEGAK